MNVAPGKSTCAEELTKAAACTVPMTTSTARRNRVSGHKSI
jgi:hypothetical protein